MEEKKNNQGENEISSLVEKIIDEAGLRNLPEEELDDFRANMETQISQKLGSIVIDNLGEEGMAEYEKLLEGSDGVDPEKMDALTSKYIPDLDQKIESEMTDFFRQILKDQIK